MALSGQRFGHIRINESIGEGGMGMVYAAFDETLHRRVAVKVLQEDQQLDPEARARLIREARALSHLDHRNICRIYDYIEADGADLLVLEYIEGKSLRKAIDDGTLDKAARLRIATSIAEALVVAHRGGIIHRDLKPENVMLTADGEVKVLDFGLARWLEDRTRTPRPQRAARLHLAPLADAETIDLPAPHERGDDHPAVHAVADRHLRTAVGITVGTPIFMSPEQARGEWLTPASDMYSFGLLLQTLLTGTDPHPAGLAPREVMLRAARGEALSPDGVPRELRPVVRSLRQFAPTDRPTAADVVRRLAYIAARPKRIAQRAAVAVLAGVMLVGGAKYTVDLRHERAAAVLAERRALDAQKEAAQRRGQAEELINFMLGDLRKKLEPVGKLDVLDDVGERALAYSGSLRPELMSADELARNAKALSQLGEVRIAQGRLDDATPIFERALSMASLAVAKQPGSQPAQLALMTAHYEMGTAALQHGKVADALREMESYLASATRLVTEAPDNDEYRIEQAYAHANVGTLLMSQGRFAEAGGHFEETLRIKRSRLARDPSNVEWQADLANTINKLGVNLQKTGNLTAARRQFEEQKRINGALAANDPRNAQWKERLALSHAYLGTVLLSLGALPEAEGEYAAERELDRQLLQTDPENMDWSRNFAIASGRLANVRARHESAARTEAAFASAIDELGNLVSRDPSRVTNGLELASALTRRAMFRLQRGAVNDAHADWVRASLLVGSPAAVDAAVRKQALNLLLVGMSIAARRGAADEVQTLAQQAGALLAAPPLTGSSDPDVTALRVRLLVATNQASQAAPLIERLDAIGYHHPDYEWIVRGH